MLERDTAVVGGVAFFGATLWSGFELLWKVVWIVAFALRMWFDTGLDAYASEILIACLIGVVLVPIVIPWSYVLEHYVSATGDPWRKQSQQRAA